MNLHDTALDVRRRVPGFLADHIGDVGSAAPLRGLREAWNQGRFGAYERAVVEFCATSDRKQPYADDGGVELLFTAVNELRALLSTAEYLAASDRRLAADKLRDVLDGPALLKLEVAGSNHGRNTAFELQVGGGLFRARLADALPRQGDVVARVDGRTLRVECKRIFSGDHRKFVDNVRTAIAQVRASVTANVADGGFAVIDLSRMVNNDGRPRSDSLETCQAQLTSLLDEANEHARETLLTAPDTFGGLIVYASTWCDVGPNSPGVATFIDALGTIRQEGSTADLFQSALEQLNATNFLAP